MRRTLNDVNIGMVEYILLVMSYFTTYFMRIVSFTIDSDFNLLHGEILTIWLIDVLCLLLAAMLFKYISIDTSISLTKFPPVGGGKRFSQGTRMNSSPTTAIIKCVVCRALIFEIIA